MADVYMHSPRGSNNKLSEQSNNAQNQDRLFDSQNNAAGGYQIGDNCNPVCQDEGGNYDATKPGAMQGAATYYQGSELYVEWTMQHGCGVDQPNVKCQVILQYMCDGDNPGLRDGTQRGNSNTAGGQSEPPTQEEADDPALGQHEPLEFYTACQKRERNKGLYTADRNMNDNRGATATRQNQNGNQANNRNGLECPEERDYYPYWHPTPWHDIAIFTDEPQQRCDYYRSESQNVKAKGLCSLPEFNNPGACAEGGGGWQETWSGPAELRGHPPECFAGPASRDNHLGNVRMGRPYYYLWKIPDYVEGRCVLRIRYNITTDDFDRGSVANPGSSGVLDGDVDDYFFVDSRYNGDNAILKNDPTDDWINLGADKELQLQVNTNQYGRTFQDRSHSFLVEPRPEDVPRSARIVNYGVRGRRGNIVQVYPAVEYDFVPQDLHVEQGDYLHFQWTGSDANQAGNAGNGRDKTDRSNLVQVQARGESVPLPIEESTLLFDASKGISADDRRLVEKFAYLDQTNCDPEENNANALTNCHQLNGASAYFNGGLVEMRTIGEHHITSTRNSDFSNRAQKATILVSRRSWEWYVLGGIAAGAAALLALIAYVALAVYALKHPASWLFSQRYRPRILRCLVRQSTLTARLEQRRDINREKRRKWAEKMVADQDVEKAPGGIAVDAEVARPTKYSGQSWTSRCVRMCAAAGLGEQRLTTTVYFFLNVAVFAVGAFSNLYNGYKGSWVYPLAKGAGYSMDLNFAVLVLPTLKSLQTAMRRAGTSKEWLPIDDPIAFHVTVAVFIMMGSVIHIVAHCVHIWQVANAPLMYEDPLDHWSLTPEEHISGMTYVDQLFNLQVRCAAISGIFLVLLMGAMYTTALSCVRRSGNRCARRLGGYNLFWKFHMCWPWVYVLLLLHAPTRLWIWFFFPAVLVAADRVLLGRHQKLHAGLRRVKLLPRDVIGLTFDVPKGFAYQAGQYILLGWRGEWHPFTLTSAPEENKLSVHIRAPDSLDWCSALRRRLVNDVLGDKPRSGEVVEYSTCAHPGSSVLYSRPELKNPVANADSVPVANADSVGHGSPSAKEGRPNYSRGDSLETSVPEGELPSEAVVMQITGPFGAPAQKVWSFDTIMVVGAGIGVTPFASILRSVQLRTRHRETILKAAARSGAGADSKESLEHLVSEIINVPKKIAFYWIVRGQEEFDWFYDILKEAVEGPAKGIVEITVFLTGEIELSKVRDLGWATGGQFFGRPNWSRIFKQKREQNPGQLVGVFLCGSPAIGQQLTEQSHAHSDMPGTPGGTRFLFYKEHF